MGWYSKLTIGEDTFINCPSCGKRYVFGPIFDHHKRHCLECKKELREWNMNKSIYLIDVEKSPDIIKEIILYLDQLTENEAYNELRFLEKMKLI